MARSGTVALAALIVSASTLSAVAADFGAPPPVVEAQAAEPQLEFATNWYIRGDVGGTRVNGPILSSDSSFLSNNKPNNAWAASAGFGYKINDWFRADLTGEYHKKLSTNITGAPVWCPYGPARGVDDPSFTAITGYDPTTGQPIYGIVTRKLGVAYDANETCNPVQGAQQNRAALLLNAYVDLGNWHGVTPYVGAGAGLALIRTTGGINYFRSADNVAYTADNTAPAGYPLVWVNKFNGQPVNPQPAVPFGKINWDRRISRQQWNFAWALMGGVAIDVAEKTKLDIGYRYTDFGSVAGVAAPNGQVIKQHITNQEVRVGLRYMID